MLSYEDLRLHVYDYLGEVGVYCCAPIVSDLLFDNAVVEYDRNNQIIGIYNPNYRTLSYIIMGKKFKFKKIGNPWTITTYSLNKKFNDILTNNMYCSAENVMVKFGKLYRDYKDSENVLLQSALTEQQMNNILDILMSDYKSIVGMSLEDISSIENGIRKRLTIDNLIALSDKDGKEINSMLNLVDLTKYGNLYYICNVLTPIEKRDKGYARELISSILLNAQSEYRDTILAVDITNGARSMYSKLGFEIIGMLHTIPAREFFKMFEYF